MREKQSKRERDTLCNVLSTNHRKFGEWFPSIFIPKLYRQTKTGPIQRHREKEQREQSKMGPTVEWSCKRKNLCVSLQEENHVRYSRKETLCQVQLQEDEFLDGFLDMDFLGSSLVFCLYEEKQKKDWPMMMRMGRFPRLGRNSAWQTIFAKCLPFVLWERMENCGRVYSFQREAAAACLAPILTGMLFFFFGFCCWLWGLFSCSHHWTQQSCHDTLALSLTTYLPEFLNCILCSTFVTSTHLESAVQQRVCCLIN